MIGVLRKTEHRRSRAGEGFREQGCVAASQHLRGDQQLEGAGRVLLSFVLILDSLLSQLGENGWSFCFCL